MFFSNKKIILPENTQGNWHEDFIIHLASIIRPRIYVELGLYHCDLFNKMIPFVDQLIGVDINPEVGKYMQKSQKTKFVCSDTNTYHKHITKTPITINMLFIDAHHSKESVLEDFEHFFPFVADQGIILLHDGYPKNKKYSSQGYCGDAFIAIEKLSKKTDQYEMTTIPIHPGLTICRKRTKHLPWK